MRRELQMLPAALYLADHEPAGLAVFRAAVGASVPDPGGGAVAGGPARHRADKVDLEWRRAHRLHARHLLRLGPPPAALADYKRLRVLADRGPLRHGGLIETARGAVAC